MPLQEGPNSEGESHETQVLTSLESSLESHETQVLASLESSLESHETQVFTGLESSLESHETQVLTGLESALDSVSMSERSDKELADLESSFSRVKLKEDAKEDNARKIQEKENTAKVQVGEEVSSSETSTSEVSSEKDEADLKVKVEKREDKGKDAGAVTKDQEKSKSQARQLPVRKSDDTGDGETGDDDSSLGRKKKESTLDEEIFKADSDAKEAKEKEKEKRDDQPQEVTVSEKKTTRRRAPKKFLSRGFGSGKDDAAGAQPQENQDLQHDIFSELLQVIQNDVDGNQSDDYVDTEKDSKIWSISEQLRTAALKFENKVTAKQEILSLMNQKRFDKTCRRLAKISDELMYKKYKDDDTAAMIVSCQPEDSDGFLENLYAIIERVKAIKLCCDAAVDGRCNICGNGDLSTFYSPLSIPNTQGYCVLSAALVHHHRVKSVHTDLIVRFICDAVSENQADVQRILAMKSASIYRSYAVSYPVLKGLVPDV